MNSKEENSSDVQDLASGESTKYCMRLNVSVQYIHLHKWFSLFAGKELRVKLVPLRSS